jgi:outer membrane protein OmpA-like peptidoglycan-associated protein
MTFKGYGTSKPIHPIPEKTEQEENENRRVEILIFEK